jgi:hypothetical protein
MARNEPASQALSAIPALREEFRKTSRCRRRRLNRSAAPRGFFELAELMCLDALGANRVAAIFVRSSIEDGEGPRRRAFCHVAAWEYRGRSAGPP